MEQVVIRILRQRRLFAYEFARLVDISESRFRRILKGRVRAREDELKRIAGELGVAVNQLTGH